MAAPADPARDRLSPEEIQGERLIAVACRNARLRNEEISKKRNQLRNEIHVIQQQSYNIEAQYWSEYQMRLREIHEANSKWPTRKWIGAFAENERTVSQAVAKRQDKLRQAERLKQEELAAVDRDFWAAWGRDVEHMGGLSPLPSSSGSMPAATEPMAAPQPADAQASKASPATHSSSDRRPSVSKIYSSRVQKQRVTRSSVPTGPSPLKKSTTAMKPVNPRSHSLSPASRALKGAAMARARVQGTSPSAAATPSPHLSSPDPSISATSSLQRRRPRSSSAAASPWEQSEGSSSAPASRSLTPKSAITSVESRGEPSQEPADSPSAQPANPQDAAAAETTQPPETPAPGDPAGVPPPSSSELSAPQSQDGGFFAGVTDPVVGEIYQGFYKDAKYQGWWMCTPLPWDSWERDIGIKYSTQQANLFRDLPDCYTSDRVRAKPKGRKMKSVITGWKKGFEVDGPRARERVFPVLFFDDVPGEPGSFKFPDSPAKIFTFNKQALNALPAEWVAASDLRMPGADVGRPVRGCETAERFRERVRARRVLRAEKKLATPKRKDRTSSSAEASSPVNTSSAVEASSAMGRSSPAEAPPAADSSSAVEETTKDDIEMADAESLSGATAVDDAPAGQPDVLEGSKATPTTPTAKTPPVEKSTPNSSEKEWRSVVFG